MIWINDPVNFLSSLNQSVAGRGLEHIQHIAIAPRPTKLTASNLFRLLVTHVLGLATRQFFWGARFGENSDCRLPRAVNCKFGATYQTWVNTLGGENMSQFDIRSLFLPVAFLAFLGTSLRSEALIDTELNDAVDFRTVAFSSCLNKSVCSVGDISISAQRRDPDIENAPWVEGQIYWDPVDGLGIRDGAQNDEIDFNERLILRFSTPVTMTKVWLSDLFHTEDRRYRSGSTDRIEGISEDAEVAGVTLQLGETTISTLLVEAESKLTWASFNQEILPTFRENGDLRRRIVIDGERIVIVAPGDGGSGRLLEQRFEIAQIGLDKKSIFDGVETVEIDLTEILAEFSGTKLFSVGTTNFEIIEALLNEPSKLENLHRVAHDKRDTIRMSNGEVGQAFGAALEADTITFFAPFDASNDFSISGIVLE